MTVKADDTMERDGVDYVAVAVEKKYFCIGCAFREIAGECPTCDGMQWRRHPTQSLTVSERDTQRRIASICDDVRKILLDKNKKYGNSAIDPVRIFSTASPIEQINVRIDDKISRIVRGKGVDDEDVELDLIGYLILRRVARAIGGAE